MNNRKSYVTIFPECEVVHLKKDVGMLPYAMGKYQEYNYKIVTYQNNGFSEKNIKDYCIESIDKNKGQVMDFCNYIAKNAKKIDILNLYHITSNRNAYWIAVYKLFNPKGKVHVKLDADYRMIDVFNPKPTGVLGKIIVWVFKHLVDLYTVETTEMQKVLTSKWNIEMKLLPNGIYLEKETSNNTYVEKEDFFLTVGRLGTEQKATEVLLEAYKNISDKTTWDLMLVGPIEESFKQKIDQFFSINKHLKSRVTFVGNIDNEEKLRAIYDRAKVFVLPSRWESFGLVLLEALERGDYLVTSDQIPSIPDINHEGKYCKVVPADNSEKLGEAMLEAAKLSINDVLRAERSKWVIDNFSWEAISKQLHEYLSDKED